jgi:hypothetical protein
LESRPVIDLDRRQTISDLLTEINDLRQRLQRAERHLSNLLATS